jgi:molybdate transport system substrate-binding protein
MRARAAGAVAAALLCAALVLAACGDDDGAGGAGAERPRLVVSAATSLKAAFTAYAREFPDADVRLSFAGSDELAAQIEQGVRPDVFAAANTTLPERLHADGLVDRPRVFAGNRLVLATPAGDERIRGLEDLAEPGTTLAVGAEGVPVGTYTRKVLDRLPRARREAVLDNVRSEEPDVGGIVGKLTQGAVDAGFVYISDVRAADGALRAVELPARLQPAVAYGVAVVRGARNPGGARAFVDGLLAGDGREALEAAGFDPPPGA